MSEAIHSFFCPGPLVKKLIIKKVLTNKTSHAIIKAQKGKEKGKNEKVYF